MASMLATAKGGTIERPARDRQSLEPLPAGRAVQARCRATLDGAP
jgi:hypothetical protein